MLKLSRVSLEWALQQALNYGDTDIFPELFEFKAVEHDWGNIAQWLMEENILNWNVRPNRHLLIPKHRYGFRISTQLDPIDFLVFTALVYEIGIDIEGRRIPKTDNIVHSYRFDPKPDGLMFDKTYHYGTFQAQSRVLAEESRCNWVVTADIADFFPRLYHHRVKNSLSNCTNKTNHALAIDRLLSNWNESYSYGIPVGCAASRLIAENALDDIDKALLSEGTTFARFSDDYRIFCSTKREACEKLAFLAYVLFENHGLTLQQHKTRIISRETFLDIACTEEEAEINQMWQKYEKLASELGLSSFYDDIEWDNLSEEQQEKISELNLNELLDEQAILDEINIPMTRFILRRLAQMGSSDSFNQVVDNIDNLYPVIPDVVK
jgi:retron-type reverse transcriptase